MKTNNGVGILRLVELVREVNPDLPLLNAKHTVEDFIKRVNVEDTLTTEEADTLRLAKFMLVRKPDLFLVFAKYIGLAKAKEMLHLCNERL